MAVHGFDTGATKLVSTNDAAIYGRFNVQIDFNAHSSYAWGSPLWSNATFNNSVQYVVLQIYNDSNRTDLAAILAWTYSDFTSGNWYSTKTFSTAYFAKSSSKGELDAAIARGKLPISVHHFLNGAPGPDSNVGHDGYLSWKILNFSIQQGGIYVPTFTSSGKTSVKPHYESFTQLVPSTPV